MPIHPLRSYQHENKSQDNYRTESCPPRKPAGAASSASTSSRTKSQADGPTVAATKSFIVLTHAARPKDDGPRVAFFFDFALEHYRCWAGDAAVFSYAPEMYTEEYGNDQWNGDAVPDVGAQQGVGVHNRAA